MHAALEKSQVRFEVQSCQDTLQEAECSTLCLLHETPAKNEVAVGNGWSGYSKLLLLLLQGNIRDGYCGIFVDAASVWLGPFLRGFALQKNLSFSR